MNITSTEHARTVRALGHHAIHESTGSLKIIKRAERMAAACERLSGTTCQFPPSQFHATGGSEGCAVAKIYRRAVRRT